MREEADRNEEVNDRQGSVAGAVSQPHPRLRQAHHWLQNESRASLGN